MKVVLLTVSLILLVGCNTNTNQKNENAKDSNSEKQVTDSLPIYNIPEQSPDDYIYDNEDMEFDMNVIKAKNEESPRKLKYLFSANGGLIAYFDDGSVAGCPRCDLSTHNVLEMFNSEPHANYKEYPNHLLTKYGDYESEDALFEQGKITQDWVIINYHHIPYPETVTNFKPYTEGEITSDSIEEINKTSLVIILPEEKHFDDEESEEAQAYFTGVDDWVYYISETCTRFEEMEINIIHTKKPFLLFTINNNEQIIIDTDKKQHNFEISALLYKKNELPIVVDIVLNNTDTYKQYLGIL